MTDSEFRAMVLLMRQAQREYFKTRGAGSLRAAKDYERRVDAELESVTKAASLFDGGKA